MLAHNLCILVQTFYEFGIHAEFGLPVRLEALCILVQTFYEFGIHAEFGLPVRLEAPRELTGVHA